MGLEKIHPTDVSGIAPDEQLGRQVLALRYDLALQVLAGMKNEAGRQALADDKRGRVRLAARLRELECALDRAVGAMERVVDICRQHIEAEKAGRAQS